MTTRIRTGAWWALGAGLTALVLACTSPGTSDSSTDSDGGGNDGEAGDKAAGFYEAFGDFDAVDHDGEGDAVIDLPEGVTQAMVTATHDGDANFSIAGLDADNQPTIDLLVNTIGAYTGTTALGMNDLGGEPARLQITASGSWTITIAPLADAPDLADAGEGDAVFRYEGDAATLAATHDGDANFAVSYYTDADFEMPLLVNEIGAYDGTVALTDGPGLLVITANGAWTLTTS